jgi:hypothetical protein
MNQRHRGHRRADSRSPDLEVEFASRRRNSRHCQERRGAIRSEYAETTPRAEDTLVALILAANSRDTRHLLSPQLYRLQPRGALP